MFPHVLHAYIRGIPGPVPLRRSAERGPKVREHVWKLARTAAPDAGGEVIVDIDGGLVLAHSEKEQAARTWKKTFGHHPLFAFVDHGPGGSGKPVAGMLRPGNAGSNTAAASHWPWTDLITSAFARLRALPDPG